MEDGGVVDTFLVNAGERLWHMIVYNLYSVPGHLPVLLQNRESTIHAGRTRYGADEHRVLFFVPNFTADSHCCVAAWYHLPPISPSPDGLLQSTWLSASSCFFSLTPAILSMPS
jgi:hypothetical protein